MTIRPNPLPVRRGVCGAVVRRRYRYNLKPTLEREGKRKRKRKRKHERDRRRRRRRLGRNKPWEDRN
jgi:hypothetical protein